LSEGDGRSVQPRAFSHGIVFGDAFGFLPFRRCGRRPKASAESLRAGRRVRRSAGVWRPSHPTRAESSGRVRPGDVLLRHRLRSIWLRFQADALGSRTTAGSRRTAPGEGSSKPCTGTEVSVWSWRRAERVQVCRYRAPRRRGFARPALPCGNRTGPIGIWKCPPLSFAYTSSGSVAVTGAEAAAHDGCVREALADLADGASPGSCCVTLTRSAMAPRSRSPFLRTWRCRPCSWRHQLLLARRQTRRRSSRSPRPNAASARAVIQFEGFSGR
jgi:hypothetical protein